MPSVEGAGIAIGKSRVGGLLERAIQPDASAAPGVAPSASEYPAAETATPTFLGRLKSGQYEAPASSLPSPHQLGSGTPEAAPSAAPGGYVAPEPASAGTPAEYPTVTWIPRAPVTENPVVGSLVRAMQKSGVPIAERPNLLLKGSGRVNRILGPEEDLAGPLAKSLRSKKGKRALMPVRCPDCGKRAGDLKELMS